MFRPLELFIGIRYIRAKRRNHFISFISVVSMLGLIVGITALITVISVMNGFDAELRSRILGMVSQATITGVAESMPNWHKALAIAEQDPHVQGAAPYVEREGFLHGNEASQGAIVRGILPGQDTTLTVAAVGSEPLTFQWYAGARGDTAQPIDGATAASFTTPAREAVLSITPSHEGHEVN